MTDREKLIQDLLPITDNYLNTSEDKHFTPNTTIADVADLLIEKGWIRPPCNCSECKHLKIVDKAPIFAECSNPKVIRKFLYFEEDTRKASCEYAEEKLKELNENANR